MFKYVKKQLSRKGEQTLTVFPYSSIKNGKRGDPGCGGTGGEKKEKKKTDSRKGKEVLMSGDDQMAQAQKVHDIC